MTPTRVALLVYRPYQKWPYRGYPSVAVNTMDLSILFFCIYDADDIRKFSIILNSYYIKQSFFHMSTSSNLKHTYSQYFCLIDTSTNITNARFKLDAESLISLVALCIILFLIDAARALEHIYLRF